MAFISSSWRDSSDSLESVWSSLSRRVCKPPQLSISFLSFCSSVTMFCVHVTIELKYTMFIVSSYYRFVYYCFIDVYGNDYDSLLITIACKCTSFHSNKCKYSQVLIDA